MPDCQVPPKAPQAPGGFPNPNLRASVEAPDRVYVGIHLFDSIARICRQEQHAVSGLARHRAISSVLSKAVILGRIADMLNCDVTTTLQHEALQAQPIIDLNRLGKEYVRKIGGPLSFGGHSVLVDVCSCRCLPGWQCSSRGLDLTEILFDVVHLCRFCSAV